MFENASNARAKSAVVMHSACATASASIASSTDIAHSIASMRLVMVLAKVGPSVICFASSCACDNTSGGATMRLKKPQRSPSAAVITRPVYSNSAARPCPTCQADVGLGLPECPACGQELCPTCGAAVAENDTACPSCGTELELVCPRCGAGLAPEMVRCPECGLSFEHHCPACKAGVEAGADRCPACGQPLCPACGAAVGAGDESCAACGAELRYFCPVCEAQVGAGDDRCPVCGEVLED